MHADLSAYISFTGCAREALEYYHSVFGGHLDLETFAAWNLPAPSGREEDIVYGVLRTDDGFVLRGTDRPLSTSETAPTAQPESSPAPTSAGTRAVPGLDWALCLNGEERERLTACWHGLEPGAENVEPLTESPWGDLNGVLVDRFGVRWIFNIGASN
ncbi:VOC family protein [Actinomyces sp. MRS3W]|uniref:VOC family protein n=1 Tax=Actinomyces sp. MRS3W TaxID=2800796 RepID=UPI0028FDA7BD|nr:VOC family protein [Actinomyces sp. MRS3W]MDU0348032.1 VOC family protein [Actinomyces sp. MRS3W]